MKKTLGGERLGTGSKIQVDLHNYSRSSHNLGRIFKTDMAAGTLVPFMCELGLNGDTFDIDLTTKVRTLPTNGPLFGLFKQQLDLFVCPIRLYIAALHNNMLGVGMDMAKIKLPIMSITGNSLDLTQDDLNSQQVSQSSLLAYLGVRGLGKIEDFTPRNFNGIPLLAYWDIYKNYYANKQEEIGFVIGSDNFAWSSATLRGESGTPNYTFTPGTLTTAEIVINQNQINGKVYLILNSSAKITNIEDIGIAIKSETDETWEYKKIQDLTDWKFVSQSNTAITWEIRSSFTIPKNVIPIGVQNNGIALTKFNLNLIDEMREAILAAPKTSPFTINETATEPYRYTTGVYTDGTTEKSISAMDQAGLGIKTYLSDRFNNWLSTEWIDGENGIASVTAVDVSNGELNLDALNLAQKVYNMLNRIAVSGGSYNDWQEAVYGEDSMRMAESPIYIGGMSAEIGFDEVVSTADSTTMSGDDMPLGSLAGRGADRANRGGKSIKIKIKEPSFIIGITSLTPRIDYSQGNKWYTRLETMNDLHKPALDGIGFQELITDEMAAWDTDVDSSGVPTYRSAGKQPAWIEYMTAISEAYGSFAMPNETMFMTLNRRYSHDSMGNIKDLTTYIDPAKYNYAFADAKLTAKNFWVQIAVDCIARRKMSAKVIPNL